MISVIIPVFNAEKHLKRCLDSILNQTYHDFEIILVDDGSTDNSRLICEEYKRKDSRIEVYSNSNKGPGPARNYGIEMAKGDYIYFMDSDDEILPNLLEENYNIAIKTEADIVCFSYLKIIYKNRKPTSERRYGISSSKLLINEEIPGIFWELQDNELVYTLWNKLYKRELILKNNVRFTELRKGQDALFNFEIFKYVNRLYVNKNHYYKYHLYDENNITSRFTPNLFQSYKIFDSYLMKLINEWKLEDEESKSRINEVRFLNINTCMANLVKPENNNLNFMQQIKECKNILNDSFTEEVLYSTNINDLKNNYRKVCFIILKTKNCYVNLVFQKVLRGLKKL